MENKFERRSPKDGDFFKNDRDNSSREACGVNSGNGENRRPFSGGGDRSRRSFGGDRDGNRRSFGGDRDGERRSFSGNRDGERRSFGGDRDGNRRPFSGDRDGGRRPFGGNKDGERRSFGGDRDGNRRPFGGDRDGNRRSFGGDRDGNRRPFGQDRNERRGDSSVGERRSYNPNFDLENRPRFSRENGEESARGERRSFNSERRGSFDRGERGGFNRNNSEGGYNRGGSRPYGRNEGGYNRVNRGGDDHEQVPRYGQRGEDGKRPRINSMSKFKSERTFSNRPLPKRDRTPFDPQVAPEYEQEPFINKDIRLNRYIAMSGVCSRRDADVHIAEGLITVNGEVVTELGTKVKPTDTVCFNGEELRGEKKVYIVMNKPKGYVTTVEDDHAERTVLDLLKGKVEERIYPVGRLDKNTLGVLLLTNDGDLTKQLTHPSYNKKKIYHILLDRNIEEADMESIAQGVELEDGLAFADEISLVGDSHKEIGVEIHSGRNRIVRRLFEHFGYKVMKLDRVYFGGITKKGLQRGFWRHLTNNEVIALRSGNYR